MRVMAFVQARMGSSRLPGKSLMPVWGDMNVLEMTLRRALRAATPEAVVLCTSTDPACDALETLALRLGAMVFRGPENDVLARYALAARRHGPDAVVRICADSPLVDPEGIDALTVFFHAGGLQYATHAMDGSGLPDGLGCEVFTAAALYRAHNDAVALDEREHVSLHLRRRPETYLQDQLTAAPELRAEGVSLDIDTQADLDALHRFLMTFSEAEAPYWRARDIAARARAAFASPART